MLLKHKATPDKKAEQVSVQKFLESFVLPAYVPYKETEQELLKRTVQNLTCVVGRLIESLPISDQEKLDIMQPHSNYFVAEEK
jgi:hypothetical protein